MDKFIIRPDAEAFLEKFNSEGREKNRYFWRERTDHDLYEFFVSEGHGYSQSYDMVWEPLVFPKEWKTYARTMRADGNTLEWISMHVRLIYHKGICHSQLVRLFNEEAAEKQRGYDREYRRRLAAKRQESQ